MSVSNLELTRIFVKVVQCGSFSKAADLLRVPKSTVSKAVSRLERDSGTKLLLRTTRSLTPTAAGRAFYDSCLGPIQVLEEAQKSLDGRDSLISGLIRVTAPEDLGGHVISPALSELLQQHSGLRFEMLYSDEIVDLVRDGFDLAVRIGQLRESGLKAKRIGEVILVPVASPDYLKRSKKIRTPRDLEEHHGLSIRGFTDWWLKSESEKVLVKSNSRMICNQMTSLLSAAIAGGGIALVPNFVCVPALQAGTLARVLPGWVSPGLPVTLLSPLPMGSTARLKVTSDHLMASIQKALKSAGRL